MFRIIVTIAALITIGATQKEPHFLENRSAIVHLFEWKWTDIAKECETFLGPKGFAGVQISPPNENQIITTPVYRPWWERYEPVSYILETRSGSEAELSDMINRCNKVGVRIYADIVINNMAATNGTGTAGSSSDPPNKSYPAVPYTKDDFNPSCTINNYNDPKNVRNCELSGPDLDQSKANVREALIAYIDHLIYLGVAGFRVDAALNMWPEDLQYIYGQAKNLSTEHGFSSGARPFFYQEVVDLGGQAIKKTDYIGFGRVLDFKYGVELGNCFLGPRPLRMLKNFGLAWGLLDFGDAVVFIDNHVFQRGGSILTYKTPTPYRAATAFMLAYPFYVTRLMSSFEADSYDQGPPNKNGELVSPEFDENGLCTNGWVCEHRWPQIYHMVEFRNIAQGENITNWWDNGEDQIAFSLGSQAFVVFTAGGDIYTSIQTNLSNGTYCDVISGYKKGGRCTGKHLVVDKSGMTKVELTHLDVDIAIAIHIGSKLLSIV